MVFTAWSLVIVGMTTLLIAANRKKKDQLCSDVLVNIKGGGEQFYVEKTDVLRLIQQAAGGKLLAMPVKSVDLAKLEKSLETNAWIGKAELYFDGRNALHVSVEERDPIARVFTTEGGSFYIDSSGRKMPLLEKMSARVPVVTGFPHARKWSNKDSMLFHQVKQVAGYIDAHEFWRAQIGQIDITPQGSFELIPVVGDHIIKLGTADNIGDKLNRLHVFYRQVLARAGFSKYSALDLQYEGQVVAVSKGPIAAVDSIQLQKNIEELMNRASLQQVDAAMLPQTAPPVKDSLRTNMAAASGSAPVAPAPARTNQSTLNSSGTNPAKTTDRSNPTEKTRQTKTNRKPKAVMRKNA
ncbi:MAG TPA: hypothetical protein VFR58_09540 [Flavisolibacter sp.]|nr:hypothetical protein [Flavisolibacter sp.]